MLGPRRVWEPTWAWTAVGKHLVEFHAQGRESWLTRVWSSATSEEVSAVVNFLTLQDLNQSH